VTSEDLRLKNEKFSGKILKHYLTYGNNKSKWGEGEREKMR